MVVLLLSEEGPKLSLWLLPVLSAFGSREEKELAQYAHEGNQHPHGTDPPGPVRNECNPSLTVGVRFIECEEDQGRDECQP